MTISIDSIDSGNVLEFLDWSQQNGIWDGREVEVLDDALLLRNDAEENLLQLLFSKQSPTEFDQMAHMLAQIGAGREIEQIDLATTDAVPVGLRKSCSKFWKKHKTAILIGIAVVAIVTTIVVVSTVTGGAGAAGGGAALNAICNEDEERRKKREKQQGGSTQTPVGSAPTPLPCPDLSIQATPNSPSSAPTFLNPPPDLYHEPIKPLPASTLVSSSPDLFLVKEGVIKDGQYIKFREMLDQPTFEQALSAKPLIHQNIPETPPSSFLPSFDRHSKIGRMLELMGDAFIDPDLKDPNIMPPAPNFSTRFATEGPRQVDKRIGGINGVWNTLEDAQNHATYLQKFVDGESIDWVHNQTHGMLADLGEAVFLNRIGIAPNTADLLLKNWQEFHEANKDNPDATYLQFGHSQGTLQLREALYRAPQEIRDRIIVVAIAPATVIPKRLCRESFNYVSSRDVVYLTDRVVTEFFSSMDTTYADFLRKDYLEIRWVEAHKDAPWFDHDFQSPTFTKLIKYHIDKHKN